MPARYAPRRRFPPYRYLPGRNAHPLRSAEGHMRTHPAARGEPGDEFRFACDLFNAGYFWEAHEGWEDLWKATPKRARLRRLLQGLIQLAAARLKERGGDERMERALAAQAAARLKGLPGRMDLPAFGCAIELNDLRAAMRARSGAMRVVLSRS